MTDELKPIMQLIDDMRDNHIIEAAIIAHVQAAIDAALESVAEWLDTHQTTMDQSVYDWAVEFIRSRIGTNPLAERAAEYARGIEFRVGQLAERDARIAELERELAIKDNTIVDGLMKRKALERELAEARKDAERYRWLRHRYTRVGSVDISGVHSYTFIGRTIGRGRNVDEAIDAAMRQESE